MERLLLTLGTLAFAGIVYSLMLRGWRSRQARQVDLPEPATQATGSTLLGPIPGLYVGTTASGHWLDRIAVHHLADRATGSATVTDGGLLVARDGLADLFVPRADLRAVSVETSLAGKIISTGLLVVTWRLGPRDLATGFRAQDPADHANLRDTLQTLLPLEVL
jgi:hypothetical protein